MRCDLLVVKSRTLDRRIGETDGLGGGRIRFRNGGQHFRRVWVLRFRQEAAIGTRVTRHLVRFVQGLAGAQSFFSRVTEEATRLNLDVGQGVRLRLRHFAALGFSGKHRRLAFR